MTTARNDLEVKGVWGAAATTLADTPMVVDTPMVYPVAATSTTTMTTARNDLEDGETTTTIANNNNNIIFGGENDDDVDTIAVNNAVNILLVLSWIGGVWVVFGVEPIRVVLFGILLVVLNLTVGGLLLLQMCQRQRALVAAKEAHQHNNDNAQTMPDSFLDGVWERPVGKPLCCCDARSFFYGGAVSVLVVCDDPKR